jgi:hypothetical protein
MKLIGHIGGNGYFVRSDHVDYTTGCIVVKLTINEAMDLLNDKYSGPDGATRAGWTNDFELSLLKLIPKERRLALLREACAEALGTES